MSQSIEVMRLSDAYFDLDIAGKALAKSHQNADGEFDYAAIDRDERTARRLARGRVEDPAPTERTR